MSGNLERRYMSEAGLKNLTQLEGGIRHRLYDDATGCTIQKASQAKGTATIGVGHAVHDSMYDGAVITDHIALCLLQEDVSHACKALLPYDWLSQHQFDALVSFIFNIGTGQFNRSSVKIALDNRDIKFTAKGMALYNKTTISGERVVSRGLTRRRNHEIDLLLNGSYLGNV